MTSLWPHQQAAHDKIAPLGRGMLYLDMGTGKSRTALALTETWGCRRVLILAPKSVVQVWPKEFAKCGFTDWRILAAGDGSTAKRCQQINTAAMCADADDTPLAVVLNYDAVIRGDMPATLQGIDWDCLILDECHRLKAPYGKQSKCVLDLVARRGAVPHRLGLTGTPMPHSPMDVFAPFRIVNPNVLGWRYQPFEAKHTVFSKERKTRDGRKFREILGYRHIDELQARIAPHCYMVKSDEVLDLPDSIDVQRYTLLSPAVQRVYSELEDDLRSDVSGGEVTAANALARLVRLAQVANGFAAVTDAETGDKAPQRIGHDKGDLLADVFGEIALEEPVVVFGRFHPDLDDIHETAAKAGRTSAELSGRRDELAAWQDGQANVLAVQLKAGGLGVDLTRARYQVYYALDFSLGDYLQTRKRIHRPGQTRNVTYVHLIAAGTVDEQVYSALEARQDVVEAVLAGLGQRRAAA